ncbi:glycosyltransferase [Acidithiobacillus sp.]
MDKQVSYESLSKGTWIIVLLFLLTALWYLPWRAGILNENHMIFSIILYGAELFSFFTIMLHLFMTWRLTIRNPPPAPSGLRVAVLVPSLNEPLSVVRQTLLGAIRMDYPHQTYLLDDGRRPEMQRLAQDLGCTCITRADNNHAKAGALNNALQQVDADYLAIFDADHVPSKEFLTKTLGYFNDNNVAFVQTPQDFYNLDSYQHLKIPKSHSIWSEQSLFFRVIQRGKDYWNSAFFCGSCAVIRRSALDAIGGFATGTVTEDLHTSLRLHKKGYASVYHAQPLAYGLAPLAIGPYLTQRIRWGQGAMQVWRKEGILLTRGLTVPQRLNYLASAITYFDGWQKAIFYIAPAVVLFLGWLPIVDIGMRQFLWHFLPYYLLTFVAFEEINRGYGRILQTEQFNMARFWALIVSTTGFLRRTIRFHVTPKESADVHGDHHYMIPQYAIFAVNAIAIPVGILGLSGHAPLPAWALIGNVFWACINLGLATLVIVTTIFRRHRRNDYRFPVPLAVRIDVPLASSELAVAEDISLSGFRIYARLVQKIAAHSIITGTIILPNQEIPFSAKVIAEDQKKSNKAHAIGCRFLWTDEASRDRLGLFLYGSDLQWRILGLSDRIRTPLENLRVWLTGQGFHELGAQHWIPVLYHRADVPAAMQQGIGLISVDANGGPRFFLTYDTLGPIADIQMMIQGKYQRQLVRIKEEFGERAGSSVAPVYMYHTAESAAI